MKYLKIDKDKLAGFLDELRQEFRVVAPVDDDGIVLFREIDSGAEAQLDYGNSRQSPKELFFPQAEVLFSYQLSNGEWTLRETPPNPRKTVLFGVHPCDTKAFLLLDKIFIEGEYQDSHYRKKREDTTILAMACNHPLNTCFCTSVGGSPFSKEGADALFVDIGEAYLIEILTQKGKELFKDRALVEADEKSLKLVDEAKEQAEARMTLNVKGKDVAELELSKMFNSEFWDRVHETCLGCGICTFLCPTCSCFDVVDEKTGSGGERIRIWDTCQFPLYTKEASGFNPRPTGKERTRQRILHKFKYSPETYGESSCVGCGRCIVNCPVNLDIRQIVNSLVGGKG